MCQIDLQPTPRTSSWEMTEKIPVQWVKLVQITRAAERNSWNIVPAGWIHFSDHAVLIFKSVAWLNQPTNQFSVLSMVLLLEHVHCPASLKTAPGLAEFFGTVHMWVHLVPWVKTSCVQCCWPSGSKTLKKALPKATAVYGRMGGLFISLCGHTCLWNITTQYMLWLPGLLLSSYISTDFLTKNNYWDKVTARHLLLLPLLLEESWTSNVSVVCFGLEKLSLKCLWSTARLTVLACV